MKLHHAIGRLVAVIIAVTPACTPSATQPKVPAAEQARNDGPQSNDPELVGRWLLAELLSPGADLKRARRARERLETLAGQGLYASLARGLDDESHGRSTQAMRAYLQIVRTARVSRDPIAPLAGWFASNRLLNQPGAASSVWQEAKPLVEAALAQPGSLGWRARGELVEWWAREAAPESKSKTIEQTARLHGCVPNIRIAGPFGRDVPSDRHRAFAPERPGRWPTRFAPDPLRREVVPKVLKTERMGCQVRVDEPVVSGIFYIQTFFDLESEEEVLVAVQGARSVLIDDVQVLERDPREWGAWPRFGVAVHLHPGRHRIVARVENPFTSVRLLRADGSPLRAETSIDDAPPYALTPPRVLADPNVLTSFVAKGTAKAPEDDIVAFVAAQLAHVEGQDDVASVLIEPLVKDVGDAAPVALSHQGLFVLGDPIFPEGEARDVAKELNTRVLEKDPGLWRPRLWLILDGASNRGTAAVAADLRELFDAFPEVVPIGRQLIALYRQLGWRAELDGVVKQMAERFPADSASLEQHVEVLETRGEFAEADRLIQRVSDLNPDSELRLDRALRRRDYAEAIEELRRLGKLRPDREDIVERITKVMISAGLKAESFDDLEQAIKKKPRSDAAHLALADAKLAAGEHAALRTAIREAIQSGADTSALANALELLEGRTALEPYRQDARATIEAYVKAGVRMDGAAVRVLDYGVTWVAWDGSSRLLEHEIVRVQSQEGIGKLAEHPIPAGMVLRMRVIKQDGRLLEPEYVPDKPTLTMPHLEVGDYIETETITATAGPGDGSSYLGPHWLFREQDIAYWRSEFIVVAPKTRPLIIETNGEVPQPVITEDAYVRVHRWRVDQSPAAVLEPGTVPIRELLPSVRVGWGVTLEKRLQVLVDQLEDRTLDDPRLRRIAARIVEGVPREQREERARRIYRWILANVETGSEADGRRIVTGRSGNLGFGFLYLARLAGIPAEVAVVRNGLERPAVGPISEAESYDNFVIRIEAEKGPMWLSVQDRFTPFGYIPAPLRGQPGFLLVSGTPKITSSTTGTIDGVVFEANAVLRPTGAASIELAKKYVGKFAIALRRDIETVPEAQLHDAVEGQLLSKDLPGASLVSLDVSNDDDLDKPLNLAMKVEMPDFARRAKGALVLSPPFNAALSRLAALPSRSTTLLIGEASRIEVRVRIKLPAGAKLAHELTQAELHHGPRLVIIRDRLEGDELVFDRVFDIPAGRIAPDEYSAFQQFAREADAITHHDVRILLP